MLFLTITMLLLQACDINRCLHPASKYTQRLGEQSFFQILFTHYFWGASKPYKAYKCGSKVCLFFYNEAITSKLYQLLSSVMFTIFSGLVSFGLCKETPPLNLHLQI